MRLGVIADPHWAELPGATARWHADYDFGGLASRCAALIGVLVAEGCDVLVVAGDLTHLGDERACDAALAGVLGRSPIPVVVVEGNHDILLDPDLVARREDLRAEWRAAAALAAEKDIRFSVVRLGRETGSALERASALAADEATCGIVVSHYPLLPHTERLAAAGLPCPGELDDRAALLGELRDSRLPTVVLSGHVHARDASSDANVLQISVPAIVEPPHEAAIVDVDPVAGTVRCRRVDGAGTAGGPRSVRWLLTPADERWRVGDGGAWTRHVAPAGDRYQLQEA